MDFDVPPLSSAVRQGLRRRRVVLSLSGGGYRGLFSAHVLERIHREFGNGDLLEKVDLFAGTSIGAIIATALASGCQPARIKQLLLDHGPAIFPSKWLPGLRQAMGKALYDSAPLRAAIKEAMPQAEQSALGQLQVPLLLPAVNWNSSQLHVLASGAPARQGPAGPDADGRHAGLIGRPHLLSRARRSRPCLRGRRTRRQRARPAGPAGRPPALGAGRPTS